MITHCSEHDLFQTFLSSGDSSAKKKPKTFHWINGTRNVKPLTFSGENCLRFQDTKTKKCDDFSDPSETKSDIHCTEGSSVAITVKFAKLEPNERCGSPLYSLMPRSQISSLFDCDVREDEVAAPQEEKKSSEQILDFGHCRDGKSSCLQK